MATIDVIVVVTLPTTALRHPHLADASAAIVGAFVSVVVVVVVVAAPHLALQPTSGLNS